MQLAIPVASREWVRWQSGVLIVDEGARWLNSRDWNDKGRARVLDWLLHSRKRGWDVVLIIQHHNMLDKQVREGLAEMHVICRRFDRVKLLGVRLPHIHQATTYYGIHLGGTNAPPKAESVMYSPKVWGVCYDTAAEFQESQARYSMLSRWHLVDRYKVHVGFRGCHGCRVVFDRAGTCNGRALYPDADRLGGAGGAGGCGPCQRVRVDDFQTGFRGCDQMSETIFPVVIVLSLLMGFMAAGQ